MKTAKKWFYKLPFPSYLEEPFLKAISGEETQKEITNLVNLLKECDKTEAFYREKGIPEEILIDTLSDIAVWAENCRIEYGKIGVMETEWLKNHISGEIFRIGRLQFKFGKAIFNNERLNLKIGDNTMEVHIPGGEKLTPSLARESIKRALAFFKEYFPEYNFEYFTCESWTLDVTLKNFLKNDANLIQFGDLFDRIGGYESRQAFRYLFALNPEKGTENGLQKKIREYDEAGGRLYETYGVISKERAESYESL